MKQLFKDAILFCIGGALYIVIEILWRGHSHWTMFIVGGLAFYLIGCINEVIPWRMAFWKQMVIGAIIVTDVEFVAGCIINLWLGWNVWNYSDMPFNILGQICLPFTIAWFFLSAISIIFDDYLRYWCFGEEKPRYMI